MSMNEDNKRLGTLLKTKRKELNLTLKEVENSTSIRSGYIEAIEEGEIYRYIANVYAQGFIKQYAIFLGFDAEQIMKENPQAFKGSLEKHDFAYGIGTLESRGSLSGGVKWLPNLVWAGVATAVIVLAWYLAKFLGVL
jgi:cytoskeletal protein RodZ